MYKVGIIGPESSGKSTLAQYLAKRYNGIYVPEYARRYVEQLNRPYTRADVEIIAHHQIEQLSTSSFNLSPKKTTNVVFFDTELIITKVWLLHKYGDCPQWLDDAIRAYPMDVYLLCAPDIPWVPDPTRENPDIRQFLFDWYEREIQSLNTPYYIIKHC